MDSRVSDITNDLDQEDDNIHTADQHVNYYGPTVHFSLFADDSSSVSPLRDMGSMDAAGDYPMPSGSQGDAVNRSDTRADSREIAGDTMEQCSDGNDTPDLLREENNFGKRMLSSGPPLRHPATKPAHLSGYSVPGGGRLPSRNSGVVLAKSKGPYVNKAPQLASQKPATEASLLKRGLTKFGEATMSRRASGANDPENITIVNLVDNHGKKWSEVAEILNGARIAKGLQPSFTANGVHNRYNRNAPLLSVAEGREFIPICERNTKILKSASSVWTPELDKLLVEMAQTVDAEKWPRVALLFNQASGMNVTAEAVAYRHSLI